MVLVLFGSLSFVWLGLDMMPELEFPTLTVSTAYPGAAAEDVEQLVTRPIESVIAGIKGIDKITSTSSEGLSVVSVNFSWGSDLDIAAQDIRENISRIRSMLPEDIIDPMVMKFDMSMMPVVMYGVSGMGSPMELQKYFRDAVVPRVERLEGVASVLVGGGPEREINVFLNKARLDQYRIGPAAVAAAISARNVNVAGGHLSSGHQEYLVRTLGEFNSVQEISNTVITTIGGIPIRVGDVAHVEDTQMEMRNFVRMNGKDGIVFMVRKQSGSNTLQVVQRVRKLVDELAVTIPGGVEFITIFDQGEIVERATGNATQSAVVGGILAVMLLWLFLRNWRPTLVIALAIPISIVTTFIGMYLLGYTLNMITIGGFALAVGLLIDNAVVVIENTYRHLEMGSHRNKAAIDGASEVGLAIGASTLTTIAVFVPLALAGGFAGKIAQPLALTVCAGLLASLLVAVTIVPMLASVTFKRRAAKGKSKTVVQSAVGNINPAAAPDTASGGAEKISLGAQASGGLIFRFVQRKYIKALGWALNHRAIVLIFTFALLGGAIFGITQIGAEFMAESDNGMVIVEIKMPIGTNLEETNRLVSTIEERILAVPEVMSVCAIVGDMGGTMGGEVNEAQIFFRLKPFAERSRSTKQVSEELRRALPKLHDVVINFSSGGMMGGSSNPIEIKFFGSDINTLKDFADRAKVIMDDLKATYDADALDSAKLRRSKLVGPHDVTVSMREGKPEMRIFPDHDKSAGMGFTNAEIGASIRHANLGHVVTRYREAGEEFDVRIRLDEADRETKDKFLLIPAISRTGVTAHLMNIGEIRYERGPVSITRENRVRNVTVTANTNSRDIQGEVLAVQAALKDLEAELPTGYFIEYGGSFEEMQDTFKDLLLALVIAIVLVYMVMAAQFESFAQPFVIMLTVPLAFIGVVPGLAIMGHPLSVVAFMGIIILVGIVLNNGIVLIDYINQLRARGVKMREALIEGGRVRLRPILITTLTTIIAVLPMALSGGQGSEMQSPLGTAVAFGLASSMVLTLFVVPIFYSIVIGLADTITRTIKRVFLGEIQEKAEKLQKA
jgi:HAE1 family hydrophobic/amphiphilic exporter-1